MKIFVFGNPDLQQDSLPLKILPELKKCFNRSAPPAGGAAGGRRIEFKVQDPNEEWEIPEELIVIDTILGIDKVTVFLDLKRFEQTPRNTLHDFDALNYLRYLQKLGKLRKIKIIGLPPTISEKKAIDEIAAILKS
jgi:Ni,Fe-hydrogenase maturation factor